MAMAFSALVAAYFAVCIGAGVRVINRRETWAKRTVIAVAGLPLVYVASFGPACWLCEKGVLGQRTAWTIFRPATWYCLNGPERVRLASEDTPNFAEIVAHSVRSLFWYSRSTVRRRSVDWRIDRFTRT